MEGERPVVLGNSLGGLMVLHLALSEPERVSALVLSDSAALGQAVNPAQAVLSSPGGGELAATWAKTPAGATERAFQRGLLLFARPWQIPESGSRTSAGWRKCRTSWKRRWLPYARTSEWRANATFWWTNSLA